MRQKTLEKALGKMTELGSAYGLVDASQGDGVVLSLEDVQEILPDTGEPMSVDEEADLVTAFADGYLRAAIKYLSGGTRGRKRKENRAAAETGGEKTEPLPLLDQHVSTLR